MDSTDGLSRGYEVVGTGNPIQMPVGADVYGRLFQRNRRCNRWFRNLPKQVKTESIHRQAPRFEDLSTLISVLLQVLK
jgi:F-type H+-transporting ATPase subunit beta